MVIANGFATLDLIDGGGGLDGEGAGLHVCVPIGSLPGRRHLFPAVGKQSELSSSSALESTSSLFDRGCDMGHGNTRGIASGATQVVVYPVILPVGVRRAPIWAGIVSVQPTVRFPGSHYIIRASEWQDRYSVRMGRSTNRGEIRRVVGEWSVGKDLGRSIGAPDSLPHASLTRSE